MEKPSKAQTLRRESPGDRGVYNYIPYTTVPGHTRDAVLAVVRESAGCIRRWRNSTSLISESSTMTLHFSCTYLVHKNRSVMMRS